MTAESIPVLNRQWWRKRFRWLLDNPVVLKELRGRMRGARAFIVLTVYLLLLGAFSSLIYLGVSESSRTMSGQVSVGEIGRTLFAGIVATELLLVAFIAPAFTSGAISSEREHQTFDLLRTTLLPPRLFVFGKLLSGQLYVVVLLLAAVPLQSIAFFFGGVEQTELLMSFVILSLTALLFGSVGLYFSARSERTLSANVLTYGLTMFVMFGIPVLWTVITLLVGFSFNNIASSNTQIILLYASGLVLSTNPAITAGLTQYFLINRRTLGVFSYTLANGETVTLVSPWIPFTIIYVGLSVLFFVLTVRRVNKRSD